MVGKKLFENIVGPIRAIHFVAIIKESVWHPGPGSCERVVKFFEIVLHRNTVVVVQNVALAAWSRTLHFLKSASTEHGVNIPLPLR